jgi:hypothetical protein
MQDQKIKKRTMTNNSEREETPTIMESFIEIFVKY